LFFCSLSILFNLDRWYKTIKTTFKNFII
jgi:hypothetical protein